jgi:hypothetical protein
MAPCKSDLDCRAGYACAKDGSCMAAALEPFVRARVGDACTSDFECQSHKCIAAASYASFPGGACSQNCGQDATCPTGSLCSATVSMLFGGQPTCVSGCSSDKDCRGDYFCSVEGTCLPRVAFQSAAQQRSARVGAPCAADAT